MQPKIIRPDKSDEELTHENCYILETFNTGDYPGLSIARARVLPGATTQWHALGNADEFYYILSGRGRMEMEGKDYGIVRQGDVVCIPKGIAQRITNTGEEDLIFICLCTPRFRFDAYENREDE